MSKLFGLLIIFDYFRSILINFLIKFDQFLIYFEWFDIIRTDFNQNRQDDVKSEEHSNTISVRILL